MVFSIFQLVIFLSTLSLRRATQMASSGYSAEGYFYPRSPCGERQVALLHPVFLPSFLSTLSLRRATAGCPMYFHPLAISIHALLAESDPYGAGLYDKPGDFYPRSPCGERPNAIIIGNRNYNFYPRSPCGERLWSASDIYLPANFYPRSPCGERPSSISYADPIQ